MIHIGDCREVMRKLIADETRVQMCVTSPPYWGLRDYGVDGQLGLEKTPEEYVGNMVEVFRLVRDILADDGTLWVNLGDSYYNYRPGGDGLNRSGLSKNIQSLPETTSRRGRKFEGLKEKDLVGIPWLVAFALRADGWYLRQDIIWSKPNPMPESVVDRCTKSHEYLFLLAKNQRYYYDAEAIKEPSMEAGWESRYDRAAQGQKAYPTEQVNGIRQRKPAGWDTGPGSHGTIHRDGRAQEVEYTETAATTRNKRSVWTIATHPYPESHFATFPPALIEPCILAGSRVGDTVLDPFFGSGTTGQVCERLGRKWIGIELNPKYLPLAQKRTAQMGLGI